LHVEFANASTSGALVARDGVLDGALQRLRALETLSLRIAVRLLEAACLVELRVRDTQQRARERADADTERVLARVEDLVKAVALEEDVVERCFLSNIPPGPMRK
jgi:hypothetical protein